MADLPNTRTKVSIWSGQTLANFCHLKASFPQSKYSDMTGVGTQVDQSLHGVHRNFHYFVPFVIIHCLITS